MQDPETKTVQIIFLIAFVLLFVIGLFVYLVIQYRRKYNYFNVEKEELKTRFSETLLQSQLEIQEQTLQRIGYELHDNLGQVASLIKINLNTLQLTDVSKATEKIEITKELVRQLISDIKSLSVSLSSDQILRKGLPGSLETEVQRLNKTGQFNATFTQTGNVVDLDTDKAVILYRMSQEILNNIVKHSGAKQVEVLLNAGPDLFTLAFNDDGFGFDPEDNLNNSGAGLRNLQKRSELINAKLSIKSTKGTGTTITIEVPL